MLHYLLVLALGYLQNTLFPSFDIKRVPNAAWAWEQCRDKKQPIQPFLGNPKISFAAQKCALICRLFVHINICKQGLLKTSAAEPEASPLCTPEQETPRSNQCSCPWEAKRRERKGWINAKKICPVIFKPTKLNFLPEVCVARINIC